MQPRKQPGSARELIPILPRSGVYLMPYDGRKLGKLGFDVQAEEKRFAALFRTVFRTMPTRARRSLLQHWRTGPDRWSAGLAINGKHASPGICLVDRLGGRCV